MKTAMPYRISFKIEPCEAFPGGLSDSIGCDYRTAADAEEDIRVIQTGTRSDLVPELATAALWVTDDCGNCY